MISLNWSHIAVLPWFSLPVSVSLLWKRPQLFSLLRGKIRHMEEAAWQNPLWGRCKIFENVLNAARRGVSVCSFFTSFV
jgi:hypothetical protein